MDFSDITVAILAGGLGTRLRPVVSDRPKVLAEVQGKPFLAHLLDQLTNYGVSRVVLCTGYLGEQIYATFPDTYKGINLDYSREQFPLGTAGALRLALPLLKSDSVLVMNGDSFCNANLELFTTYHREQNANITILLTKVFDAQHYGHVKINKEGRVQSFVEKGRNSRPGWINTGIYMFERDLLKTIPENQKVSLEKEVLPTLIGQDLYGYRSESWLWDIGTPEGYALLRGSNIFDDD